MRSERQSLWWTTRQLLEMIRFSHTLFALPFALLAAIMAWTAARPDGGSWGATEILRQLAGILICMVGARSAAMAFNRIVDRKYDAANPRTRSRHLPAGTLSVRGAVVFTALSSGLFLLGCATFLPNPWPCLLGIPVLAILLGYSYTKRYTSLAHFYLGGSLMLAPVCAWIAIRGQFLSASPGDLLPAGLIGLAVLLWVSGFDIIYACQDVDYDRQARLHSVPARWGIRGALRIAAGCHFAMLFALAALPWSGLLGGPPLPLGWIYGLGWLAVALLLAYEHLLVRPDDLTRLNQAFFQVNILISLGLMLVVSLDMLI